MWINGVEQHFSINTAMCINTENVKKEIPTDEFLPEGNLQDFNPII